MHEPNLVVVHAFGSQPEADMAKSALEGAGIDAVIQADSVGGMRAHVAWSGAGFKVLVREEDAVDAREVLEPPGEAPTDES
jgi:Putative prokaryotic signal transducing protein